VDAAFLHQEGSATHMHIGGLASFEGEAPTHQELLAHIRGRLHLVPRYRQRIAAAPLGLGRQRWIDDPRFNLEYHVRHTALPAPGGAEQLRRLAARIFSQQLDRTKPLWELWMVEGLGDDSFAVISKTHHALVDGVSGVDLMTMLFDPAPPPRRGGRSRARPTPSWRRPRCRTPSAAPPRCRCAPPLRWPAPAARSRMPARPAPRSARCCGAG
jgi:WS/DGAT/MGAT family acyltransferase